MTQDYISKKGLKKLKKRLNHLIREERPKIIQEIAKARDQGDLSENAEYTAAKEKQRFIENEIIKLKIKAATLKTIKKDDVNNNEVRFGAVVELLNLKTKKNVKYKIVGEDETGKVRNESDNAHYRILRKISCKAPISKALLGKKIGNRVEVKIPIGRAKYEIKNISY